jgi:transposase-like zinc ribbon protein
MDKLKLKNTKKYFGLDKFQKVIPNEDSALKLVSEIKWESGFVCLKCGNTNYCKGKTVESRRCTRCKKEESATAHTIFHRCKIPINSALEIAYMVCNIAAISSYEISRQLDMRHMTCYGFQKKVKACLSGENDDKLLKAILSVVHERVNVLNLPDGRLIL